MNTIKCTHDQIISLNKQLSDITKKTLAAALLVAIKYAKINPYLPIEICKQNTMFCLKVKGLNSLLPVILTVVNDKKETIIIIKTEKGV